MKRSSARLVYQTCRPEHTDVRLTFLFRDNRTHPGEDNDGSTFKQPEHYVRYIGTPTAGID